MYLQRIKKENLIIPIVLLIAFILRMIGINFGLPYKYHIDEQFYVPWSLRLLNGEISMPAITHGPNFYLFNLAILDIFIYFILFIFGKVNSPNQFAHLYELDPSSVYLAARLFSVITGTLTVLIVYVIGKRIWNKEVGLFAAIVLGLSFLHIRQSHFAVPDVFLTFCISLSFLMIIHALETKTITAFSLAGFVAGISSGVKFTGGLIALSLIVATLTFGLTFPLRMNNKPTFWRWFKLLLIVSTSFSLGFMISYPVIILNPQTFIEDLKIQSQWALNGFPPWQLDEFPAYIFYVKILIQFVGLAPFILGLLGVAYEIVWGSKISRFLFTFLVPYYFLIILSRYYFARFVLPMVPFLALFAGSFSFLIVENLKKSKYHIGRRMATAWILPTLGIVIMIPSFLNSIKFDSQLIQTDTRTLAKQWIENNIPTGEKIAVDWPFHGPPLATLYESVPYSTNRFNVTVVGGTGLSDHSIDWYREQGYDYLIASSFIYNIPLIFSDKNEERKEFYKSLDQEFSLVKKFSPSDDGEEMPFIFDEIYGPAISLSKRERPGPNIKIFEIKK